MPLREEQLVKPRRGGRGGRSKTSNRAKDVIEGSDLAEKNEVLCHVLALAMTKRHVERLRSKPGAFHHSCERKQKTCVFLNRFEKPQGLDLALNAVERNERFDRIQCP